MGVYLMGIDIGTTSSKGLLVNLRGEILAEHTVEHGVQNPRPGWAEHDADKIWWQEFATICRALQEKAKVDPAQIAAVGCTALYPVVLPVDQSGRPLRSAILYGIDTRSVDEIALLNAELGSSYGLDVAGNVLSTQSVAPKILWLRRNEPSTFLKTYKFMNASGYVVHRLTGAFIMDHNSASLGGLPYNIHARDWDEETCRICGIEKGALPALRESTDVVGYVTAEAARATGLRKGTPVCAGAGDFGAEMLSIGAYKRNQAIVSYGTTFSIAACIEQVPLPPPPNLMLQCHPIPGRYIIGGGMATGAALTKWFRDNFAQAERDREKKGGSSAYQFLSKEAEKAPPGAEGLIVLPYFSGERCPIFDPDARGLVLGLTLRHKRHHVYRALLEGVAYSVRHVKEILEDFGVELLDIKAVGGATRSKLFTQIVSDVIQREQVVLKGSLGAPLGACILAGLAASAIDGQVVYDWLQIDRRVFPSKANRQVYNQLYHMYIKLYGDCKSYMHTLSRLDRGEGVVV